MAKVVVMPKLGYTQDEGTIAEWHKQVGDPVAIGDPFFDVHTDKSVITVEASCAGTLLKIALEPGNTVPVLTPVAVVGEPGEDADAILASHVTAVVADAQVEALLAGSLAYDPNTVCSHHDHGEGHTCGHHHEGGHTCGGQDHGCGHHG